MTRRAVLLTLLSRSWSRDRQIADLLAYADEHDLAVIAIVVDDPGPSINLVSAGGADVVLTLRPDSAGALARAAVPVVYVHPPALPVPRPNGPADGRALSARTVGGVPGLLVLQALERTDGDAALIARIFDVAPALVEEFDRERRERSRRHG